MKEEGLDGIGCAIATPILCVILIVLDSVIPDFVKVIGVLFLCVYVIPYTCLLLSEAIKKVGRVCIQLFKIINSKRRNYE